MKNPLKTSSLSFVSALTLASVTYATEIPTGDISADASVVRAGEFPRLDWNITYPGIDTLVCIQPDGEIVTKADVEMQVRVLAADVQSRTTSFNRFTGRTTVSFSPVRVVSVGRINGGSFRLLFNDIQANVNPVAIPWQPNLEEGDRVSFAAQANFTGSVPYFSGQNSPNVLLLKDGDVPPTFTTWDTQSTLGTHIAPYLDETGAVDIGPRDVIVVFELTHVVDPNVVVDPDDPNGTPDFQDMILLLTFQKN